MKEWMKKGERVQYLHYRLHLLEAVSHLTGEDDVRVQVLSRKNVLEYGSAYELRECLEAVLLLGKKKKKKKVKTKQDPDSMGRKNGVVR